MSTMTEEVVREIYLEAVNKIDPSPYWDAWTTEDMRRVLLNKSDESCQTFAARVARRAMKAAVYARLEHGSS